MNDNAAGPAEVLAEVDTQGMQLRAPTYDARRLVAPANSGATVLDTTYPVTLPDADGTHSYYVTAYDAAGNWTTSQAHPAHVILDRVAPALVNAPAAGDFNAAGWCHNPCRVTTRATDDWLLTSSVSVNGGIVTPYSDTVDLAKLGLEGPGVAVAVAATDRANNANGLTRSYKVDVTAPTVIVNAAAGWQRTPVDVVVTASDALSGVATSSCTVDHAPAVPATTFRLEEGVHAVSCSATDAAGNTTTTTRSVSIDGSAPVLGVDAADAWVDRDQVVTVTATDPVLADGHAGSGVASFGATVDGHPAPIVDGTVRVQGEGQHALVLSATDAAGNVVSLTRAIRVDATAPAGTLSAAPRFTASPDVTLHWSASDATSGLGAVRLVVDGQPGADLAADGARAGDVATDLQGEGSHTISLQATDVAGNSVTLPAQTVVFDATAPAIAAPKVNGANAAGWCTSTCGVVIAATDGGAGLASISATVNGEPVAVDAVDAGALSIARTIDVTGARTAAVTVVATLTDNAGNSRSVSAVAHVDADAPRLALVGADPASRGLRVAVAYAASGVREVTAAFGSALVALSPTGERDSHGAAVYAAVVPTAGWPSDLHGVALLVGRARATWPATSRPSPAAVPGGERLERHERRHRRERRRHDSPAPVYRRCGWRRRVGRHRRPGHERHPRHLRDGARPGDAHPDPARQERPAYREAAHREARREAHAERPAGGRQAPPPHGAEGVARERQVHRAEQALLGHDRRERRVQADDP